jgi:16S rRNA (adenine1518-N6/adenine1519-N6)-dimethyltransferase
LLYDKSQCFLVDKTAIDCMLKTAEIQAGDTVFEVGPGKGALTYPLLHAAATVIAVEKDPDLASRFEEPGLTVFNEDVLKFNLSDVPACKVVASLPYYITTDIIEKLLPHPTFLSFTFMVQWEAALRFLAEPKTKPYNAFTLIIRFFADVKIIKKVPRGAFRPIPRVDSAIVFFKPHPRPDVNPNAFIWVVKQAFAKRRKMIRQIFNDQVGFATQRPEELTLDDFVKLTQALIDQKAIPAL